MKKVRTQRADALRFQPLIEWWLVLVTLIVIALLASAIPVLFSGSLPRIQAVGGVLGVLFAITYVADTMFFTYYQLDSDGLLVGSQLRRYRFAFRSIRDIRPAGMRALFSSTKRKRFSFSPKALELFVTDSHWESITLSPSNRDLFLKHIFEYIDHERSSRATTERRKK